MEKISQMMDGELDEQECRLQIRRLAQDNSLSQDWETFHLIRDVLRNEASAGSRIAVRVSERLQAEPTVIAPHTRLSSRLTRYLMPMAAVVAGVTVVGWLAFSTQEQAPGPLAQQAPGTIAQQASSTMARQVPRDYLFAHWEYSPRTAMQGVASYSRTSSDGEDTPQ